MAPSTTRPDLWSSLRSAAPSLLLPVLALGCAPATSSDPAFWASHQIGEGGAPPDPGSTGPGGAGGSDEPPPTPSGGLTLEFTTLSNRGEYAPDNIGAVWITDAQDNFVKTLEVWAAKRAKHLVKWRAASKGHSLVDAVTRATRGAHVAHESYWNGTNSEGGVAPEGAYRIYVEFTEDNSAEGEPPGPWMVFDFEKGAVPGDAVVPDQRHFNNIHLTYAF
ncbi:DUF2271 domain-containing protein [Chondromyces crocatus]|uniref:DUF2271 domain-containing protein n=1 Tax=Chondromyces crocatus TaxID=52 RepID=A0A0K1ENB9_CHOCO|nr:DUF2271 domain-containing protein [Chondromyces crocatus]AKT42078.1 uncharacterized protein CMC5_063010 [Chondromyces crocatus]